MTGKGNTPLVFDIRHCALDDGPGIRTTVFFKGCPLRCIWCHNPESIFPGKELFYRKHLCTQCGKCVASCPSGARDISLPEEIIRVRCKLCAKCVDACSADALSMIGKYYTFDELISEIIADSTFYQTSGGGVTFSGGEPTIYIDFLSDLVHELKSRSVNIALQTCGYFDMDVFERRLLPCIDIIFYDIKIINDKKHRLYTGVSNSIILNNFEYLTRLSREYKFQLISRTPLIPGVNDSVKDLDELGSFLNKVCYPADRHIFLEYNSSGGDKMNSLINRSPSLR